jgi:ATP-dependent Lon protease
VPPIVTEVPIVGGLVVLDAIGEPTTEEGEKATSIYGRLLTPIALHGGAAEPDAIFTQLSAEFPWMVEANRRFAEAAALSKKAGHGHFRARPMLLVGPPGSGKTRWARRAAELAGLSFAPIPVGGLSGSLSLSGNDRGWRGGRPTVLASIMLRNETANPLVLIDELDKAERGGSWNPSEDTLLAMLEPESAKRHLDHYLLGNLDLSWITWIIAVNDLANLSSALVSRLRVIKTGLPEVKHLAAIIPGILTDIASEHRMAVEDLPDITAAMPAILRGFPEDRCLRALRRAMEDAIGVAAWSPPGPRLAFSAE